MVFYHGLPVRCGCLRYEEIFGEETLSGTDILEVENTKKTNILNLKILQRTFSFYISLTIIEEEKISSTKIPRKFVAMDSRQKTLHPRNTQAIQTRQGRHR